MGSRLDLQVELETFTPNVYFQAPSGFKMLYPCVVYNKTGKDRMFANDGVYFKAQEYQLTVMDLNPDSEIADLLEEHFESCVISQYYTVENINHTTLNLYY